MQNVDKSHLRNLFLMNCFIRKLKMVTNLFDQRRKKELINGKLTFFINLEISVLRPHVPLLAKKKLSLLLTLLRA